MTTINYIFAISAILNAILLMVLFGIMPFLVYMLSILLMGMLWYTRKLLKDMNEVVTDMQDLLSSVIVFENHVSFVHSLEMYYGDESLQKLMQHTRNVVDELEFYKEKYRPYHDEDDEMEIVLDEQEREENDNPETEETEEQVFIFPTN